EKKKKKKKRQGTDPSKLRGTDEPFLRLMGIGGPAVLKLLGFAPDKAEGYTFRSVVLKERRLEPDTEGIPLLEGQDGKAYIEFQGYSDKFIRYRLVSEIMLACSQDGYKDRVFAGIVYTDEAYRKAALPVKALGEKAGEEILNSFEETVLTDYTEAQLTETDPRLIVLAPFTVPPKEGKTEVISRGRRWKQEIIRVYPEDSVRDALNITGLFLMNRFRNITREEVISMLNFDLADTVAGQQIFEEGIEKGVMKDARDMVIEALTERFVAVPSGIRDEVYSVGQHKALKELHRYAIRSSDIEEFRKVLSKVSSAS
ncbi:MAG: DUF2887 domain-containing protein, partial [Desulfobacteraceae bacterium]|nr:DUF2887 domain-containing protein [Desulfobacteraceae bacterium]